MIRKAFVMQLNPGMEDEYQRRHNPIWKELETVLKEHGVRKYSIFLLKSTYQLFAHAEIESEEKWESIARTEVCQRWWNYMKDVMPTHPDSSPVSEGLKEVFFLD